MPKTIKLSRSQFSENFLYLNGQKFSLNDYPHMRQIYDSDAKEIVLKFSRQTAKSTTLANLMISNSAMIPHFKSLYIAPAVDQAKVFSHDRVAPVMEGSPIIKEYFTSPNIVNNVFKKQLLNGSTMNIRYALLNADRIRGYSADMNIFDEAQDLVPDIIPVVKETMSRSNYKISLYSGTPKRTKGTLADLWKLSTQNEFVIKCKRCNKWNILGEDNIGPKGVICYNPNCRKTLDLRHGQWASTFSQTQAPDMEGYRVCILHFAKAPWVDWKKDVLDKKARTSKATFLNESLALEYDDGVAPITEIELQAACNFERPLSQEPTALDKSYRSMAGIDYGPINSEISNTVFVVVQERAGKLYVVYAKKFTGKEADYSFIHKEVPRLMKVWNADILAADHGMGEAANSEIRSRIGFEKVIAFQHMHNQKEEIKYNNKLPAYTMNRTKMMQRIFDLIKKGKIEFPRWEYFKPFADDIMNIQLEADENLGKMKFVNIGPDDFFHALLYAVVSIELKMGKKID